MTSQEEIQIFTDGSCLFNGRPTAKASSACCWPNGEFEDQAFYLEKTSIRSNNRAEFFAIIKAYEQADEIDSGRTRTLHVYTDCQLAINTITKWCKGWEARGWTKSSPGEIKNLDMVKTLYEYYNGRTTVFTHVRSHKKVESFETYWNDRVDKLAYSAVHADDNSQVIFADPVPEAPKRSKCFKSNKKRKI